MDKLTYTQAKKLRTLYGLYKETNRSDYDSNEEYSNELKEAEKYLNDTAKEFGLTNKDILNIEKHIYSKNQLKFIKDCEDNGNGKLHYDYSGRGMFGDVCPAFYCDDHNDLQTKAKTVIDSMGMGIVIYAKD